jgi:site-specific DNA recombinase
MMTPRYAAIYARVSTEDQGKGSSIPTQIEGCQKLAERDGYVVRETRLLIDEGISGTTMDRPALRRLRELVQTQAIAAAIVYDPERAGVTLLIVSHPLEQGPEGWLFFQMRGALAEYERAKILERLKRGLIGRAKAGHPSGDGVALGYRYVKESHAGRWEIDDDEAVIVRRIFALCLEGMPTRAVARASTGERIPIKHDRHPEVKGHKLAGNGAWHANVVRQVLTYEGYIGRLFYNKERANGKTRRTNRPREEWIAVEIPAIISAGDFQAVQAQLARN